MDPKIGVPDTQSFNNAGEPREDKYERVLCVCMK